jgi:hypothetical protein
MKMAKGPSERGYRTVMLTDREFDDLFKVKEENGLSSATSAVRRLPDASSNPSATMTAEEVERIISFAKVTGASAQRIRDWFGV